MMIPSREAASITFIPFGTSISKPSMTNLGIGNYEPQSSNFKPQDLTINVQTPNPFDVWILKFEITFQKGIFSD
jgi:hypothetical protein